MIDFNWTDDIETDRTINGYTLNEGLGAFRVSFILDLELLTNSVSWKTSYTLK